MEVLECSKDLAGSYRLLSKFLNKLLAASSGLASSSFWSVWSSFVFRFSEGRGSKPSKNPPTPFASKDFSPAPSGIRPCKRSLSRVAGRFPPICCWISEVIFFWRTLLPASRRKLEKAWVSTLTLGLSSGPNIFQGGSVSPVEFARV